MTLCSPRGGAIFAKLETSAASAPSCPLPMGEWRAFSLSLACNQRKCDTAQAGNPPRYHYRPPAPSAGGRNEAPLLARRTALPENNFL